MPSSPKVLKETILETAYNMLIQEGYSAINIKNIAKELGCSTQPISRQFGSMEGLREELVEYCLEKFSSVFSIQGEQISDIISGIAERYLDLAYDYPNIYKYFYMSEREGERMGELARSLRSQNYDKVVEMLMEEYEITREAANDFMKNMDYYVHGIVSYIATGFINVSKEELMKKIERIKLVFLIQAKELIDFSQIS